MKQEQEGEQEQRKERQTNTTYQTRTFARRRTSAARIAQDADNCSVGGSDGTCGARHASDSVGFVVEIAGWTRQTVSDTGEITEGASGTRLASQRRALAVGEEAHRTRSAVDSSFVAKQSHAAKRAFGELSGRCKAPGVAQQTRHRAVDCRHRASTARLTRGGVGTVLEGAHGAQHASRHAGRRRITSGSAGVANSGAGGGYETGSALKTDGRSVDWIVTGIVSRAAR